MSFAEQWFRERGHEVVVTREPGGTTLSEEIRTMMLDPRHTGMHLDTELLLAFASRVQHIQELIKPALAEGKVVLSSRFTSSTYAYQGAARGAGIERVRMLERAFQDGIQPDMTIVFDLDPEQGMARASQRGELDRIERERIEFFHAVRADFRRQALESPERYCLIDASQSLEGVQSQLLNALASVEPRRALRPAGIAEGYGR
jgi:dTMP kinase